MAILRDISFLWSMLHVYLLFLILFEPRYSHRVTFTISTIGWAALLAGNILIMLWKGPAIIMRAAFFTCTIPSAMLYYRLSRYRDGRFFFLFCLTDTISFWLMQITNLLDRLAGGGYLVLFLTRLIFFPLLEWFFWRWLRTPYMELQRKMEKGWWLFAAVGAVYYLLIMAASVPVGFPLPDRKSLVALLLILILMPLTYFTIFGSLWQQMLASRARTEAEVQTIRSRLAMETIRILQSSARALAQTRHDILGHLNVLQTLDRQKESEKLTAYLDRVTRQTREIVPLKLTPHPIVNALLVEFTERAKKLGAELRCQIDLPKSVAIPDEDLSSFLMNLLNNAMDALEEIPPDQPRWVEVTMHIRGRYLFIEGRNPYASAPEPGEGGARYRSRRGPGHGYGLGIMESLARQYESELQIKAEDGVFLVCTALLMPNKATEKKGKKFE